MPYLFFIAVLTLYGGLHLKNTVVYDSMDQMASIESQKSLALTRQLSAIKNAIQLRRSDYFLTDWECVMEDSVCTDTYNRIVLDDGYVTEANWKDQLIPDYLTHVSVPDGWDTLLIDETDQQRVCFQAPTNVVSKRILTESLSHAHKDNIVVTNDCSSDIVMTGPEIQDSSLSNLYLQIKIKKTL